MVDTYLWWTHYVGTVVHMLTVSGGRTYQLVNVRPGEDKTGKVGVALQQQVQEQSGLLTAQLAERRDDRNNYTLLKQLKVYS